MRAWIRQFTYDVKSSYWFIPAIMTLGAIALSLFTWWLDVTSGDQWVDMLSWLQLAKPEGARSLLSTIAGTMISVAGTVFAITIAAVVYASGNYGPRLLNNFMTDRGNQVSLGVFIATFVYALLILRTIRLPNETGPFMDNADSGFVPQLSLLVAIAMALLSVAVLVYFLHHVPNSIKINNVVAGVGRTLLKHVERRYPDEDDGKNVEMERDHKGEAVIASTPGYVEIIDFSTLASVADKQGVTIRLAIRTGDFVHPDIPLCYVEGTMGEDCAKDIRHAFGFGDSRNTAQDVEFSIDELVEIALRALSPGINDPFTALTCLHWLGAAMSRIATRSLRRDSDGREFGKDNVYAMPDNFEHFIHRSFGSLRYSASANDIASIMFIDTLWAVSTGCGSRERLRILAVEAATLVEQARHHLKGPAMEELETRERNFRKELDKT